MRHRWVRFGFAGATSALVWLAFRSSPPFIPALAALIISVIFAGTWPSLLSLGINGCWLAMDGNPAQCFFFFTEGAVLCAWAARIRTTLSHAKESERWHRQLTETTAEGVWVTDENGVIVYANPGIAEILGLAPGRLIGRRMEEFLFREDVPVERMRLRNHREGANEQFDRRLRCKGGSEAWVLVSCSSLPSRRVLSMMTNITERKNAEQALQSSEERFRSLFNNAPEGVYQSTPDGRLISANPMLLRMLGLKSESELANVDIRKDFYLDPVTRSQLMERLERDGKFRNVEYSLRRADGKIIRVLENARVVRGTDGKVLYYEGTLAEATVQRNEDESATVEDFNNVLTAVSGYARLILEDLHESHPAHSTASDLLKAVENAGELTRKTTT